MSISNLTFGSPIYDPPFSVSSGDTGVMKLRSRETAPLTHESLDENFTNLANKINEILGLKIDLLDIGINGKIGFANLSTSAGSGLDVSSSGEFTHQARPSASTGYWSSDIDNQSLRFVNALDFDSFGHVAGYKTGTITFATSGHLSASVGGNAVTISSTAYGSGDSPTFSGVNIEGSTNPELRITDTNPTSASAGTLRAEDGGVSFGAYTNHPLYLVTNNSTKMTVLANGNVGISNTNPSATFHVGGNSIIDGNVGIGTAIPQRNLDIYDSGGSCANRIWAVSDATLGGSGMIGAWTEYGVKTAPGADGNYYTADDVPDYNYTVGIDSSDAHAGSSNVNFPKFKFGYSHQKWSAPGDSDKTIMTLQPDGNVGIGTTSPLAKLDIRTKGDTPNDGLIVKTEDGGGRSVRMWVDGSTQKAHIGGGVGTEDLILNHAGGNVGIGTQDPQRNLDIYDTGGSCANRIWAIADQALGTSSMIGAWTEYGVKIAPGADGNYYSYDDVPDYNYTVGIDSADASSGSGNVNFPKFKIGFSHQKWSAPGDMDKDIIVLQPNGNVGIGTTEPGQKLSLAETSNGDNLLVHFEARDSAANALNSYIVYDPDADFLALSSSQLIQGIGVDNIGNVGIGTTSPEGMLEIFHGDSSWNKPGLHIKGEYPTIKFNDTNANAPDWYIHQNGQSFYILADRDASGEDSPINDSGNSWENPLPFHLNCTTNVLQVFGNEVITEANIVNYTGGGGGGSSGTSEYSSLKLKADNPALVIQDSSGVSAQLISVVSFNDELDTQRGYAGYDSASDGVFKIRNSVGDIFLDSSSFNYKIKNSAGQWKGIIHEGNISSYITSGGGGSSGGGVNDRKTIAMKGYSTSVYIDPSLNVYGVGNSSNTDLINLTSYAALQEGSAPDGTYNGIPAGTYIDVTSYSMFRLVVVFNDYYNNKPPMQLGPRLVTELGTLNGFNTHAGSWYRTNTAHLGHQGVYNPPSNNLYYGANGSTTGTKQYTMEVNSVEEGSNVVRTIETSVVGDNTYPTCGWKGRANYSAGSTPRLYIYFPEAYSTYFLEGIKK